MKRVLFPNIFVQYHSLLCLQGADVGLEHHLHRGRALAALNHLLSARVHKLKSDDKHLGQTESPSTGQTNIQSDVQTLLSSITESEESLLSSVRIKFIIHSIEEVIIDKMHLKLTAFFCMFTIFVLVEYD